MRAGWVDGRHPAATRPRSGGEASAGVRACCGRSPVPHGGVQTCRKFCRMEAAFKLRQAEKLTSWGKGSTWQASPKVLAGEVGSQLIETQGLAPEGKGSRMAGEESRTAVPAPCGAAT